MNENNENKKVREEQVKRQLIGDSKARLLALRKEQAEAQASLRKDDFSLEDALDEMKSTLLVEEDPTQVTKPIEEKPKKVRQTKPQATKEPEIIEEKPVETPIEVKEEVVEVVPVEVKPEPKPEPKPKPKSKPKKPKPLTEEQKKALKEKEKEKARLAKQKEREKEKARLAKQKEREKEKARLAREKEKEKEKERQKLERQQERQRLREEAKRLAAETQKESFEEPKDTSVQETPIIETVVEEKQPEVVEETKESLEEEKVVEDRPHFTFKVEPTIEEEDKEPSDQKVVDNLQKLREQIMAQKKLERELMEREAVKTQQKDRSLMSKLTQLEDIREIEEEDAIREAHKELLAKNKKLNQQLNATQDKLQQILAIQYNNQTVIDDQTLSISTAFIDAIAKEQTDKLSREFERLQTEFEAVRKQQETIKQTSIQDDQKLAIVNDLSEDNRRLKTRIKELELENERQKESLNLKTADIKADYEHQIDALKEKHTREQTTRDAQHAKELNEKIQKFEKKLSDLQSEHQKEIKALERQFEDKDQTHAENKGLVEEYLKKLNTERTKYLTQIQALENELEQVKLLNVAQKQVATNVENRYKEQVDQLIAQVEQEKEKNKKMKVQVDSDSDEKIAKLQLEITRQKEQLKTYQEEYEKNTNLKIVELQKELDKQQNLFALYKSQYTSDRYQKLEDELQSYKSSLEKHRLEAEQKANEKLLFTQREFETFKKENDAKTRELHDRLDDLKDQITTYRKDLDKTRQALDHYKQALIEERNSHYEVEQKLFRDLDSKEQELLKLKTEMTKVPQENRLDTQINTIAHLVSELENKAKAKETPTVWPQMPYGPYYQDPFQHAKYELEKELEKRDRIIEELRRDRQTETTQQRNQTQESALSYKINHLEDQVKELGTMLRQLPKASETPDSKQVQTELLKNLASELEKYKQELKQDMEKQMTVKSKPVEVHTTVQALVDAYTREKELLAFEYNNEKNKLEIEKKFATSGQQLQSIENQLYDLYQLYVQQIKAKDVAFQKAMLAFQQPQETQKQVVYEKPIIQKQVIEQEETIEEPVAFETPSEPVEAPEELKQEVTLEELPVEEAPVEEKQPIETPRHSTWDIRPNTAQRGQFVGTVDPEYLNKINQIRKLQKMLEDRRTEENLKYEESTNEISASQEVLRQKIDVVKGKLSDVEQAYRSKRDFGVEREKEFENEKTRLYLELQTREEQLRKLQDEDKRKMDVRHKNIIQNIEEQLKNLEEEEKRLKETYLLKQQKTQSQLIREAEIKQKLEAEKSKQVETRIIESQEVIKQRALEEQQEEKPTPEPLEEEPQPIEEASAPVEEAIEQQQLELEIEPVEEPVQEEPVEEESTLPQPEEAPTPSIEVSEKEKQLMEMYEKYGRAEKQMVQEVTNVRVYKQLKMERVAYQNEYLKQKESLDSLKSSLRYAKTPKEIEEFETQINNLQVRQENLKVRIDHRDKQLKAFNNDKNVREYMKLVEKLESMEQILRKYAKKRDNKTS